MLPCATSSRSFVYRCLIASAALGLIAGCGGEPSRPKPVLHVMGAILVDQNSPTGGPYEVAVVVSLDSEPVTDAVVTMNGTPLLYTADPSVPEHTGYAGLVALADGAEASLSVTCAGQVRSAQATSPGKVQILSPAPGATFADGETIPVSWSALANGSLCIVACGDSTNAMAGTMLLPKTATTCNIPASETHPPGSRISVMSLSGQGALPTPDLRDWVGQDGFWISSQSWVDVQITS